jgi:cytochrome c
MRRLDFETLAQNRTPVATVLSRASPRRGSSAVSDRAYKRRRTKRAFCASFPRPPLLLSHGASHGGPLRRRAEKREENVRLLRFSIAGAALVASIGAGAAQDAAAGEKVFAKCKVCHQIGENAKNVVGPVLNGVVGRPAGTYPDYHYSDANKNSGITWDEANLKEYLKDPKAKVPGTKMIFPGLKSDEDIANVIAYLKQFGPDGKKI